MQTGLARDEQLERARQRDGLEPLLLEHRRNHRRKGILASVRDDLQSLPESAARRDALGLLDEMCPASRIQSWALLRDLLRKLESPMAQLVDTECELVHLSILSSARTGADIIPALHSICSRYMDAHHACLDSWRDVVRGVVSRFEDGVRLDGAIKDYIVDMARFGTWPEDDAFVIMVEEVYVRNGHYGAVCDICEQVLAFGHEDAQYTLPLAHIESCIELLADHAIAQNIADDAKLIERCVSILKRRAEATGSDLPTPKGDRLTLGAVSGMARSLKERRRQDHSPQTPQYAAHYPFMYAEFSKQVRAGHSSPSSTIRTEEEGLDALAKSARVLERARSGNSVRLRETLDAMMAYVSKGLPFDSAIQGYVTGLASTGTGASHALAYHIMVDLCMARRLYVEVCDMCAEMNAFEGHHAQRMAASPLIECVIGILLAHMTHERSRLGNVVVGRCATLLQSRSERLGLGRVLGSYRGDALRQADLLASDIMERRRILSPPEICSWVGKRYPLSYEFLDLGAHENDMTASKSTLANHLSDHVGIYGSDRADVPHEGLERLEALLGAMERMSLDPNPNSVQWRGDMRAFGLWDALLEMGLYVHCKAAGLDAILCPKIDAGRYAALRVGECHIEAYSPLDLFAGFPFRAAGGPDSLIALCERIMGKSQLDFFGKRQSVLAVECDSDTFDNPKFRRLLETQVPSRLGVGGILLVLGLDDHYRTSFIANSGAETRIPEGTVKDICGALGSRL